MEKSDEIWGPAVGRRFNHMQTYMNGLPYGGTVEGVGVNISWQRGPLRSFPFADGDRIGANGAFVEDIIQIAVERLEFYQNSPFACEENEKAIAHLEVTLRILNARTQRRIEEGKEGTWEV